MNAVLSKQRNASLDLLRIISMLMVTTLHFWNHGGLVEKALQPHMANFYIGNTVFALCFVSVNCFVMISGYFQSFKLSRIVSVWGTALFYSVVIYLVVTVLRGDAFSIKELLKSCMVVTLKRYWFVTAYILMMLLSPFMNKLIYAMNKKEHGLLCAVLLLLFSVLPNVVYIYDFSGVNGGNGLIFFCVLYFVASYFRLYVPQRITKQKLMFVGYLLFALVIVGERVAAYWVTPFIFGKPQITSLFYSYNSIACVGATLCLFQFFRGLRVSNGMTKLVTVISPLAFAVYLIHDHPAMREYLWAILNPAQLADSPFLTGYMLLCVFGIFLTCCLIEYVRIKLFDALGIRERVKKRVQVLQDRMMNCNIDWIK